MKRLLSSTWPVSPSHADDPMSQPFENQKQAWPLAPVRLRGSLPAAAALGCAHQLGLSNGMGHGTAPDQGVTSPSTALRLGGMICEHSGVG